MAENPYASPAPAPPSRPIETRSAPDDDLRSAFKTTAVVHIGLFILTALMLDGGRSNQFCILAMIGYWIATLFILMRRHKAPTRLDFWLIRYGVIPIWLISPWIADVVYYFIGESSQRGIDRFF